MLACVRACVRACVCVCVYFVVVAAVVVDKTKRVSGGVGGWGDNLSTSLINRPVFGELRSTTELSRGDPVSLTSQTLKPSH